MPRKNSQIPARFEPQFWLSADGRSAVAKEIKRRYQRLKLDAGIDSYQRDLLAQRAIFIALQLETQEIEAVQNGTQLPGTYIQGVNSLMGILKALGLELRVKSVGDLSSYLREQEDEE